MKLILLPELVFFHEMDGIPVCSELMLVRKTEERVIIAGIFQCSGSKLTSSSVFFDGTFRSCIAYEYGVCMNFQDSMWHLSKDHAFESECPLQIWFCKLCIVTESAAYIFGLEEKIGSMYKQCKQ